MPIRDLCSYVCSAVLGDLHLADFVHGPGCNPWSDGKVHLTPLLRGRQAEGDLHLADFVHGPGCNPWSDGKVHLTPLPRASAVEGDLLSARVVPGRGCTPWIDAHVHMSPFACRCATSCTSENISVHPRGSLTITTQTLTHHSIIYILSHQT